MDKKIIANNIKYIRKQLGLSQEALSRLINVTKSAVNYWESERSEPGIDKIISICTIVGIENPVDFYTKNITELPKTAWLIKKSPGAFDKRLRF